MVSSRFTLSAKVRILLRWIFEGCPVFSPFHFLTALDEMSIFLARALFEPNVSRRNLTSLIRASLLTYSARISRLLFSKWGLPGPHWRELIYKKRTIFRLSH